MRLCKQWRVDIGVCMCVSSSTNSPVDSYLCVCVCVCYQSTPGRAVNERTICVCVRAHVRLRVGMSVCMCVCPTSSLSRQQLLACVCVYMYTNTAERLRLHKAVILLLIMKYFVLKWYRIPIQLHHATFSVAHAKNKANAFSWYANYHPTINNKGGVSKNVIFGCWSKLFKNKKMKTISHWFVENINSFYLICKWLLYWQALSPDMQVVILL